MRDTSVAWQRELDALLAGRRRNAPHSRDGRWQAAVAGDEVFEVVAERTWSWTHATDVGAVLDRIRSVSYVDSLDDTERKHVDREVRDIVIRHLGLREDAAPIDVPDVTEAYVLARVRDRR